MVTKISLDGMERLAIVLPLHSDQEDIENLRDALADTIRNSVSTEEVKNMISSNTLCWLIDFMRQLEVTDYLKIPIENLAFQQSKCEIL